jgi:hypothetical protein
MTQQESLAIEEFASNLLTEKEIEVITGISRTDVDFQVAYQRGALLRKSKIHKSILDLAEAGSAPAQGIARDIMRRNGYK